MNSVNDKIKFAVKIAWISRFVVIGTNIIFIPLLFKFLGKEELGLWFLLGNSQQFLALLGFGVGPTLTRHIAFLKGETLSNSAIEDRQEIMDLVVTGKKIFTYLSIFVFLLSWIIGFFFIKNIPIVQVTWETLLTSWTILCIGYSIDVKFTYLSSWIIGLGEVGWEGLIAMILNLGSVIFSTILIYYGGGIIALSFILVLVAIIRRIVIFQFVKFKKPEIFLESISGSWNSSFAINLIKPSLYNWLTGMGMFLVLKTDQYFIAYFKSSSKIPSYNAAYQLVTNIWNLSIAFSASSQVFISHAWKAKKLDSVHNIVIRSVKMGLIIMAVGVGFLWCSGEELIYLWLGEGNFIGYSILGVFCFSIFIQTQQGGLTVASRATEDEKYVIPTLAAALLNLILSYVFIKTHGLFGVALSTLISLSLTTGWYGVYRPLKRLKLNTFSYIFSTLIPTIIVIPITYFIGYYLTFSFFQLFGIKPTVETGWIKLLITIFTSGVTLLSAIWLLVLTNDEKEKYKFHIVKFIK